MSQTPVIEPCQSDYLGISPPIGLKDLHPQRHSSISDLELMHHYMQVTVKGLTRSRSSLYAWTIGFPALAFNHQGVSKSMLAFAALSLASDTLLSITASDDVQFYKSNQAANALASKSDITPEASEIYIKKLLRAGDCLTITEEYYKNALSAIQGELSFLNETDAMPVIIASSCILSLLILWQPHVRNKLAALNSWLHTATCLDADIHLQDPNCTHHQVRIMYGLAEEYHLNVSWMILIRGIHASVKLAMQQFASQLSIATIPQDTQTQSDIPLSALSNPLHTSIYATKSAAFTQLRRRLEFRETTGNHSPTIEQNYHQICLTAFDHLELLVDPTLGTEFTLSSEILQAITPDHQWLFQLTFESSFNGRHLLRWGTVISNEYIALLQQQPPHPAALVIYAYFNVFFLLYKNFFWIANTGSLEISKVVRALTELECQSPELGQACTGRAGTTSTWISLMDWPQSMMKIAHELEKFEE
jgi:hypothetical protein